jgi:hypothetical protein
VIILKSFIIHTYQYPLVEETPKRANNRTRRGELCHSAVTISHVIIKQGFSDMKANSRQRGGSPSFRANLGRVRCLPPPACRQRGSSGHAGGGKHRTLPRFTIVFPQNGRSGTEFLRGTTRCSIQGERRWRGIGTTPGAVKAEGS